MEGWGPRSACRPLTWRAGALRAELAAAGAAARWHKAGPAPRGGGGGERAAPPGLETPRRAAWRLREGGGFLSWRVEGARARPSPSPPPSSAPSVSGSLGSTSPERGARTGVCGLLLPGGSDGSRGAPSRLDAAGSPGLPRSRPPRYAFPWRVPWAPGPSGNKRSWGWGWGRLAPGLRLSHLPCIFSAPRGPPSAGPTAPSPGLQQPRRTARDAPRCARGGGPSW